MTGLTTRGCLSIQESANNYDSPETQQPGTFSRGEPLHSRRPHLSCGTIPTRTRDNVTNKLWSPHISIIVAKANRMLGFLRRHCSTYVGTNHKRLLYVTLTTFVRSHMGYPSEEWAHNPVCQTSGS